MINAIAKQYDSDSHGVLFDVGSKATSDIYETKGCTNNSPTKCFTLERNKEKEGREVANNQSHFQATVVATEILFSCHS